MYSESWKIRRKIIPYAIRTCSDSGDFCIGYRLWCICRFSILVFWELSPVRKYYVEYNQYAGNQLVYLVLPTGSFLLCGRESSTYIYRGKKLLGRTHNSRNADPLGKGKSWRSTWKETFIEKSMERYESIFASSIWSNSSDGSAG